MPVRIWPRPEIIFKPETETIYATAIFMHYNFADNLSDKKIYITVDCIQCGVFKKKKNQIFEQAVTEWVENWVRNNFEPVLLPDGMDIDDDVDVGWNNCLDCLFDLNPNNLIVEEV